MALLASLRAKDLPTRTNTRPHRIDLGAARIPPRNLRIDGRFFNVFNHPNFGLPVLGYAGIPGNRSTQTGFGALTYTTAPPTGLLGVGLGGDSSPRMVAFQARLEF
jgi:hypothetical protein